ncbi:5-hydroxytryptamine receptor 1-like [Paramacrobiotus metropolitanus]|uniref:5-hydroxytryptamine receptor 1-like n=1 Tax=Paramacrobiotus metropolitanus TaxID=2943436 RepID=UPI002445F4D9|nr:5-hydroxytryptamine receptor 1-like [Paramacrobiotus metropolitanus]
MNIMQTSTAPHTAPPNITANYDNSPHLQILRIGIISFILTILSIATIVGNLLVVLAVLLVPKLQRPENLLIISLAIADLLVGMAVMPIAMIYEVAEYWPFGSIVCNLWISLDQTACSASILSLCMISLDRYLVITRPFQYGPKRTLWRMISAAVLIWILSCIISIPPLFYFGNQTDEVCLVSQDPIYQIYATITAFYAPVLLMGIAYAKIYQAAMKISKEEKSYTVIHPIQTSMPAGQNITQQHRHSTGTRPPKKSQSFPQRLVRILIPVTASNPSVNHHDPHRHPSNATGFHRTTSSFRSRELKAFKTLTAIIVAFLVSWSPFFILALIRPFYTGHIPKWVFGLTLWLGYCNSTINPVLYSIFNKDFRRPFSELLKCRCRSLRKIMRTESYETQFGMAVTHPLRSPRNSSPEQNHCTARFYLQSEGDTYGEEL